MVKLNKLEFQDVQSLISQYKADRMWFRNKIGFTYDEPQDLVVQIDDVTCKFLFLGCLAAMDKEVDGFRGRIKNEFDSPAVAGEFAVAATLAASTLGSGRWGLGVSTLVNEGSMLGSMMLVKYGDGMSRYQQGNDIRIFNFELDADTGAYVLEPVEYVTYNIDFQTGLVPVDANEVSRAFETAMSFLDGKILNGGMALLSRTMSLSVYYYGTGLLPVTLEELGWL